MKLEFLADQNFECKDCSKCCRSKWQIHVDEVAREKIKGTALELRVIQETGAPALEDSDGNLSRVAKRKSDGACVFLNEHDLCSIHAEVHRKSKPIGCRQFPFLIRPTPDGVMIGASFYCPSIQKNSGVGLATYGSELEELIREFGYQPVGFQPIPLGLDKALDWPAYRLFEQRMLGWLRDEPVESAIARAIATLGRLMLIGRDSVLGEDSVRTPLDRPPTHRLEEDEVIGSLRELFLAALIGTVEAPHPEMARPISEALLEGREVELTKTGWTGTLPGLYVFLSGPESGSASELEQGILRYVRAMLWRKFLCVERPVLDNLAALSLVPGILRFYHFVDGLKRPQASPTEHLHLAYDMAEMELLTHAGGVNPLYAGFASAYVEQLSFFPE